MLGFDKWSLSEIIKRILLVCVVLLILYWTGITKILDLALYDFAFRVRRVEPMDENIVLVEWKEEDINIKDQAIVSDDSLSRLIEKIYLQKPSLVAIDLFRDVPVASSVLNDRENVAAYDRLQNLFLSHSNLFGIEQTVYPTIRPPQNLKDRQQVGASDLPSDRDSIIRRAYTFPKLTKDGKPSGIPYLGVALAEKFLEPKGWKVNMLEDNSLKISKLKKSITIKPLKNFAGAYFDDRHGLDFLINWRKGKMLFRKVSINQVNNDLIPPDFFRDRLVIIGNASSSAQDIHITPLNRWRRTNERGVYGAQTLGLEILAQVTSSIITAALNGRPLMKAVPKTVEILLLLISLAVLFKSTRKYSLFRQKISTIAFLCPIFTTIILTGCSFAAHSFGWWMPITSIVAIVWIIFVLIIYESETRREIDRSFELEAFALNLHHNFGNMMTSINDSNNSILIFFQMLEKNLPQGDIVLQEAKKNSFPYEDITVQEAQTTINQSIQNLKNHIIRAKKYKLELNDFLKYSYFSRDEYVCSNLIDIEQTIKMIIREFKEENKTRINRIEIIEQYNSNALCRVNISSSALKIVLNNLLDNAVFAVTAKAKDKNAKDYIAVVCIRTKLKKSRLQITIEDNGIGIPKKVLPKIFLPFKSLKNNTRSTGLGLYLVKSILNRCEGTIKVNSKFGQGTKFVFNLPIIVDWNHSRTLDNFLPFLRQK